MPHLRSSARMLAATVVATLATSLAVTVAVAPDAAADDAPVAGRYFPVAPQRVVDTRQGGGTPIGPGQTRTVDLGGRVAPNIAAVVLNLTAVDTSNPSYLTMWPAGQTRPVASNLQTAPGQVRAVSVSVAVVNTGSSRLVNLYNNSGHTDYVIDLFGYYTTSVEASTEGASFYPLATPQRLLDTRASGGALSNGNVRTVQGEAVQDSTPKYGTVAVAVNITAVSPKGQGYLTAWSGTGGAPNVSNVNFPAGRDVANFAVVPVTCLESGCGSFAFSVRNLSLGTHLVVDLLGFYATAFQGGGAFWRNVTPYRVVDTRVPQGFGPLGARASGQALVGGVGTRSFSAVNATVTAITPTLPTYLSVQPAAAGTPTTSTVNVPKGALLSNATQVGTSYRSAFVKVTNYAGTVNLVLDVNGGFLTDDDD